MRLFFSIFILLLVITGIMNFAHIEHSQYLHLFMFIIFMTIIIGTLTIADFIFDFIESESKDTE